MSADCAVMTDVNRSRRQVRFTTGDGAGGGADPFADTLLEIVVGQGDGEDEQGADGADDAGSTGTGSLDDNTDDDGLLQLVGGPRTQRVTVGGRTYRATEAQATELSPAISITMRAGAIGRDGRAVRGQNGCELLPPMDNRGFLVREVIPA